MTEKERLYHAMHGEDTDRPPCICPGGMMNMITTDLMDKVNVSWPEAHVNPQMMADLAAANYENGCFENVGVPFCMTIEAEAMGATVTMGSKIYEPHVTEYAIESVTEWQKLPTVDLNTGRQKVVLDAIRILKQKNFDAPIIGNITGPISTASSLMEPTVFYKELRRKKEEAHAYMQFVTDEILKFAKAQIEAGADVIAISDPSGTGEILGPKLFEEYAVKYINQIIDGLPSEKMGTIVHICGHMNKVYKQMEQMHSEVLSFDSCVPMRSVKENIEGHALMGNVSTWTLEFGSITKVKQLAVNCWNSGSNIISPACGLGTKSPIENIQAIKQGIEEEAKNRCKNQMRLC
ncbi:Methylcobalamin methyltransferase [Lachnospiraceae bacterium TWA4]|nr:Methylcobalamin methyltransferase [Lachnospiraceae bacterium TWA4]